MDRHRRAWALAAALSFSVSLLTGCGGGPAPETAALSAAPLPKSQSRLKITRSEEFVAGATDARVKIDGRDVASLANGAVKIVDVPAGAHQIVVDHWAYPNIYKLDLQTKPGMTYELLITARQEAAVAGMLGLSGLFVEAAANENGGTFKIHVVSEKPAT